MNRKPHRLGPYILGFIVLVGVTPSVLLADPPAPTPNITICITERSPGCEFLDGTYTFTNNDPNHFYRIKFLGVIRNPRLTGVPSACTACDTCNPICACATLFDFTVNLLELDKSEVRNVSQWLPNCYGGEYCLNCDNPDPCPPKNEQWCSFVDHGMEYAFAEVVEWSNNGNKWYEYDPPFNLQQCAQSQSGDQECRLTFCKSREPSECRYEQDPDFPAL